MTRVDEDIPAAYRRRRTMPQWGTRLISCLAGGLVLALMVGSQEGTTSDYGLVFRKQVLAPRVFIFLVIGAALFFAITYWPKIIPFVTRPGFWPLLSGGLAVLAAQSLMHWYDQAGDGKFSTVADAVSNTSGISALASAFFAWLAWTQLIIILAAGLTAIVLNLRLLAFAVAVLSVVAAVIAYLSHQAVVDYGTGADHSLGYAAAIVGYLVIASAMIASGTTKLKHAQSKEFVARVLAFRPGLPLVVLGLIVGLLGLGTAAWFSPTNKSLTLSDTRQFFLSTGLAPIAVQYLAWLGWVLLVVATIVSGAAAWLRNRTIGWVATAIGLVGAVLSLVTIYDISKVGADSHNFDGATGPWQNLGAGGWMATGALFLIGAGGFIAATAPSEARVGSKVDAPVADVPTGGATGSTKKPGGYLSAPGAARSALLVAAAVALFYPPTATGFWQQVLVTEIGVAMLLAVGLNVVVGWAGLLDLGFIAFYALGSYTTAYLTGSLPKKPPSWLHMTPLLAIPFAIAVCLLAGLALGAPTLRLRGDYLAIVTLGFGEIIQRTAVNSKSITNGSEGTTENSGTHTHSVPHPSIHIGPLHIHWGLNQLQYWYLLLVILVIVVILFRRLEQSRLGRAWAAVREDEIAAQATGINTRNVKLAAFAIGASTSGVAGVFFASQVGTFTPDNFVFNQSVLIVAYVVFGGMGSLTGVMAGAAMLTWLPEFLKYQVPPADKTMWIGAAVMLMMIFRPAGLIPARRRAIELGHFDDTPSSEVQAVPAGEGMGGPR
ncbi:MAG: branched-chain amino acid transporter permease [Pseudonocardiales bacterium]|nr:branched-chain amino acid transporter permease [Pseudonocardiales bacterium]